MTKTAKLSEHDLRHFTGTGQWHRHGIDRDVLFRIPASAGGLQTSGDRLRLQPMGIIDRPLRVAGW